MARSKKIPTTYLVEKTEHIATSVNLLNGDKANNFMLMTDIIHNANSILIEAKKWQTQIRNHA